MRDGDAVEPPVGAAPEPASLSAATGAGSAPIAQVPRAAPRPEPRRDGFRTADVLIAGFALLVLAASLGGLFWLFRPH